MCVQLNNGSTMWVPLSELKDAQLIETAEYARARGLEEEPAFSWWVPRTLRQARRIVKAMKKKVLLYHWQSKIRN
jgi:hypothetical protein